SHLTSRPNQPTRPPQVAKLTGTELQLAPEFRLQFLQCGHREISKTEFEQFRPGSRPPVLSGGSPDLQQDSGHQQHACNSPGSTALPSSRSRPLCNSCIHL